MRRRTAGMMIYTVTIKTEPYASVSVNGITKESDYVGYASFKLRKGSYTYSVRKEGYYGVAGEFTVPVENDKTIDIPLKLIDHNTSLLLHFNYNVLDYSEYDKTVYNYNVPYDIGGHGEFGNAISLKGRGGRIDLAEAIPQSDLLKDFTIDFRVKVNDSDAECNLMFLYGFIRLHCYRYDANLAYIRVLCSSTGNYPWDVVSSFKANFGNGFNHVALVRYGDRLYLYVKGVQVGSVYFAYNRENTTSEMVACIGSPSEWYTVSYDLVDEFRFSTVARWTSDFTPPTQPY